MSEVKGLDDLLRTLDELPERLEKRVLKAALLDGAEVYRSQIASNIDGIQLDAAAKETLKRSLIVRPFPHRRGKGPGVGVRILKPKRKSKIKQDAWYYHFFEFGTEPRYRRVAWHFDSSNTRVSRGEVWDKRAGRFRRAVAYVQARIRTIVDRRAYTGQIRAQPFIRPAAHQAKAAADEAIARTAKAKLARALKR